MIAIALSVFTSVAAAGPTPTTAFYKDLENFQNQSLTLQTERQRLESASDTLLSRQLFWTPKVSVFAAQRQAEELQVRADSTYLGAEASLNLFKGGSDWNSMKSAKADRKAQDLQVTNESLRVEIKASDLIFKSLYLTESKRIEEGLFHLKEETYKIANDRFRQGKLPLQEVTKTEVDLVQQKNRVRTAELDVLENKSQIGSLFITDIQTKAWPFDETVAPQVDSNRQLPLIEQKYWLSEARKEDWQSAKGGHWPSLDFSVTYQDQRWPDLGDNSKQWVGLLKLSLPLWSRFETSARVSSTYADYIGAQNALKDTEQNLKQKSLFLKEKIAIARANLAEAKKNLEKSKRLYQDVLKSFRLGRISTNDLILEQNRLFDSESSLAVSQLTFHQTLIETCALAGLRSPECLK